MQFKLTAALILAAVVSSALGLHLQSATQEQIDALVAQQKKFEGVFGQLLDNVTKLEKQIESASGTDEKILLLENAIISERESVFELSKIIIPPFNISKQSCELMTDQQKVELLEQLEDARTQVNDLKKLSNSMPKCDEVDQIKRDIEKELFFLNSIESIVYTNCSMNVVLSPTIWQSNIYATGWILGTLTIDDLIEQYYQRSIRYDNVTNCPIETPFYDGSQCMLCKKPTPVFDISLKKCVACPDGQHVENTEKQCVKDLRFTEWTKLTNKNFSPKDGPFPKPAEGAVVCPAETPFASKDGGCVSCALPKYFDVAAAECKDCVEGQLFDETQQKCVKFQATKMTKLIGTRWVTQKQLKQILKDRLDLLSGTDAKKYQQCSVSNPYYDGITCIACPKEFDLDSKKCTNPPSETIAYDDNTHKYVEAKPQSNFFEKSEQPYIGKAPANDANLPTCSQETPFYDGIGCIACPSPFIIFDFDSKKCVLCQGEEKYDSSTHACMPRDIVLISLNEDRLLATKAVSIDDFNNQVSEKIQKSPEAIVVNCDDPKKYSNFKECFTCQEKEFFNVETLACATCEGEYDPKTQLCVLKATVFTNLAASNIINAPADLKAEQVKIDAELARNSASFVCPIETPFSDGEKCYACDAKKEQYFFDYQASKCVGCSSGTYYAKETFKCEKIPTVSNIPAIQEQNKYIETAPSATLKSLNSTVVTLIEKGIPYAECPSKTPFYNKDTAVCEQPCTADNSYYDISSASCVNCDNYAADSHTCPQPTPHYPNLSNNNWIVNDKDTEKIIKWRNDLRSVKGSEQCPKGIEFYDKKKCVACPIETYYNFDTFVCEKCEAPKAFDANLHACITKAAEGTYQTSLSSPSLLYGGYPLNQWKDEYNQRKAKYSEIQDCPADRPYFDDITCIKCPTHLPYFNLRYKVCQACEAGSTYSETRHDCTNPDNTVVKTQPDLSKMYANIF